MTQEVLDKYTQAVARYQPLIEERASELAGRLISLGEVIVKEFGVIARDFARLRVQDTGVLGRWIDYPFFRSFYALGRILSRAGIVYYRKTMYVRVRKRASYLDVLVEPHTVHELTHCLWDVLGGKNVRDVRLAERRKHILYSEGFAEYGETIWFSDFYDKVYRIVEYSNPVYPTGRRRIISLVDGYGEEILLEIPRRWREFG